MQLKFARVIICALRRLVKHKLAKNNARIRQIFRTGPIRLGYCIPGNKIPGNKGFSERMIRKMSSASEEKPPVFPARVPGGVQVVPLSFQFNNIPGMELLRTVNPLGVPGHHPAVDPRIPKQTVQRDAVALAGCGMPDQSGISGGAKVGIVIVPMDLVISDIGADEVIDGTDLFIL